MNLFQWMKNAGAGLRQPAVPVPEAPDKPPLLGTETTFKLFY